MAERAGTAPVKMLIPLVFLERQGRSSGHKFRVSLDTNRGFRTMESSEADQLPVRAPAIELADVIRPG